MVLQRLRVPAALPEDPGLIRSIYMVAHNWATWQLTAVITAVRENATPSSGLYGHQKHMVYRHTWKQNTYKMAVILKNVSSKVNEDAYLPLQLSEALDGFYV